MKRLLKLGLVVGVACTILSGCSSSDKFEKNDIIVFLGDSITAQGVQPDGYVTLVSKRIAEAFPELDINVLGAGIGGHKVPDCQERLDRDVLQKKPTIVVIYIGINDVWHWNRNQGTPIDIFETGLKDMIAKINAAGARVVLCTPTVIGEKTDGSNEYDKMLEEYSNISRKVAQETGSQMLDLRKAFMDYLKENNSENLEEGILTTDTVHLNKTGNKVLASLMLDALNVPQ
jgi:lysophospholipase L1-like esterase